jgi:DNA replication and repair protein RecF
VLFSPDDLYLIKGGPEERRKLLDNAISQLRPGYIGLISEYRKLFDSKMRILKDSDEKPSLLKALDAYTGRMMTIGAAIIKYRAAFTKMLAPAAAEVHLGVSGGAEKLEIGYKTVSTVETPDGDIKAIEEQLMRHYASHREAEIKSRSCLTGPHKDDLQIYIDGKPARAFGSQGQTRTAALSLKLSEREIFFRDCGEYPVLLLDDVLSELDQKRQDFVLNIKLPADR